MVHAHTVCLELENASKTFKAILLYFLICIRKKVGSFKSFFIIGQHGSNSFRR